jgi:membrane protein
LQRWELYIMRSRPVTAVTTWLKSIHIKGFQGISLFDSLNFFRKEIFSARFNDRASAVSFKFIMALPPSLLLFFTLIPYLPVKNLDKTIYDIILLLTPDPKTQKTFVNVIMDFYKHKKNTLLSLSLILTLYYSSNGMLGLMRQFNRSLPGFRKRNMVKRRGMAVVLTGVLMLSVIATATFFIFEAWAFHTIGFKALQHSFIVQAISYFVIIACIFYTICNIYKYGPALKKKWALITPGSIVATTLIVLTTFGLNWIVNNLVNYNKIYGSISTLIIFILWIFYNAQILLIGFELNVSIMVNKHRKLEMELDDEGDDDDDEDDDEDIQLKTIA